jgi:hypothetical protein
MAATRFLQPAFALGVAGNVEQEVDASNEHARGVKHGCGVGDEAHTGAVGPSRDGGCASDGTALLDCNRHGALVVRKETVVLPEKSPRHAPAIAIDHRNPAGEADARLVEVRDHTFRVGDVQGARKIVEKVASRPRSVRDRRGGRLHHFFWIERKLHGANRQKGIWTSAELGKECTPAGEPSLKSSRGWRPTIFCPIGAQSPRAKAARSARGRLDCPCDVVRNLMVAGRSPTLHLIVRWVARG